MKEDPQETTWVEAPAPWCAARAPPAPATCRGARPGWAAPAPAAGSTTATPRRRRRRRWSPARGPPCATWRPGTVGSSSTALLVFRHSVRNLCWKFMLLVGWVPSMKRRCKGLLVTFDFIFSDQDFICKGGNCRDYNKAKETTTVPTPVRGSKLRPFGGWGGGRSSDQLFSWQ